MMILNKNCLCKFLGQNPTEWFKDRGFTLYYHAIGFNIQHDKTFKCERFDYPFNSAAIQMVIDQLNKQQDLL
jgi:hypothetical protein